MPLDLRILDGRHWLAEPNYLREAIAKLQSFAHCPTAREIVVERQRRLDEARNVSGKAIRATKGKIGVIGVYGPVQQRTTSELMKLGGTSTEEIGVMLDALLADSSVSTILFHVDSPGGSSYGVEELSDKIYAARGQKATYAIADSMAASAAYWIASAAETLVVTPGGDVGSVGVYAVHVDESKAMEMDGVTVTLVKAGKYKAEFANNAPMTEESKAHLQELVDGTYSKFTGALKRNRGTSLEDVRANYGQGRIVPADQAKSLGMADRVMSFDELLGRLTGRGGSEGKQASTDLLRMRHEQRKRQEEQVETYR